MGVIYKITSPSEKIYVGKTYNLSQRIASHRSAVKAGKNIILHNSIRKYGWEAHKLEVIEEVADELLNEREMFWIAELKTYCYENPAGLNMTKGGDGQRSTWMHKTELREWFSNRFTGEGNPFFGKKHSEETRKKLSDLSKIRNKKNGTKVPEWGAEKGRQAVMRPVLCYDSNGNYIAEYESARQATRTLGVKHNMISMVCSGKMTNSNGFIFRYKTDNYPLKIEVGKINKRSVKRPIVWLDGDSLDIICEFPSAKEASDFFGIPKTTINRAAMYNNLNPIRTGHVFMYQDEYLEEYKITG